MSAFLGPIHYWVYNKIKIQQELVEEIKILGKDIDPTFAEELDKRYGEFVVGPLEEIIDTTNIHGWLQKYVTQVEYKLAYSVTSLIKKNPDIIEKIKTIFREKGKEKSSAITTDNVADAYKVINDSLLDGMPCDNANNLIEESEEKVVWMRNKCVHKTYWEEIGGDVNVYYSLREEFINGILMETSLKYEKVDEVTNMIRK